MKFLFSRSFGGRINKANKIFYKTITRLQKIQTEIARKMEKNVDKIIELEGENDALKDLYDQSKHQIEAINKIIR